jgi:ESF2/ABP1 family protein
MFAASLHWIGAILSPSCRWVEFAKKSVAKRVAEMLNGQPMGGPRRSSYHYDLWNLKYLHKFKWDNLTEEIGKHESVLSEQGALLGRFA